MNGGGRKVRNINELIGIIKGINFDGIINDREIERLQSWVDKNRNLAYDQRQTELILTVDHVLEDHIIDEKERKLLLKKADEYLEHIGDGVGEIYELNGIIEGIVCDGKVNDAEVRHLKEWMNAHGDSVRKNKSSKKLCIAIDDILSDGIVTEVEQQQLLEMLEERINDSQFEAKLEYLCRLVKERKNIGTDLIDILDNEDAMKEIHKRAENQLINAVLSYSGYTSNQEIIVVSLVLIAMLEYDGNYYGSVRKTYKEVYRRFTEQKVEGQIRSILSRYKKQSASGSRSRIINVALENAIVSQVFLGNFFEFIFDIYKMNFEYDLPEEPYEDFQFVYEGLRENMLSDGDDLSINVTQKTYKLTAATKQLITKEDGLDAIIKLSIIIVKLIDRRFWDKDVKIFNPYLKAGYEVWEKQLSEESKIGRERRHGSAEMYSRWEPKFLLTNNSIFLSPPAHRIKAQYDYREVTIVILNNGEEIYRNNNCDIREIIGGYQVNCGKVKLEKPLGKLSYMIIVGNDVIYDSKDKLYRNCIVFDAEGHEINNNTDYEGTAYICYKNGEADIENILLKDFYCLGYKLIREGDALAVENDVFNFSSMVKPGVFGLLQKNCFIKEGEGEVFLSVYKEVHVVAFESESPSNKLEIVINGRHKKLSKMEYKTTSRENITKYVVQLNIEKDGIYYVEVNQLSESKKVHILKEKFACDRELQYVALMIDDKSCRVTVSSGIMSEKVDKEIIVDEYDMDFINFESDGILYSYRLPMNLGIYQISDGPWCSPSTELWIDDIRLDSTIKILDSECDGLLVYTDSGTLAEDDINLQDKGFYKQLSIGFLNSYKDSNTHVLLVFTTSEKKKYAISCYNKCIIEEDNTEILFSDDPKKIMITPVFHGKNKVFFEIFNSYGEKVYTSKALSSGQTEELEDFNSFEQYIIDFHEKTKILMLRRNTLLYQVKRTFYAREDFVGKDFKIDTVYFDQIIRGDFVEKSYYFNKAYVRITSVIDDDVFEGEIFVKKVNGQWLLDKVNPVKIEICSGIVDDTVDVYMTNSGDGLLMDFDKHGIMNSLENPIAPDIFLYTLCMKEAQQ